MAATIRIAILANAARARADIDKTQKATEGLGDRFSKLGGAVRDGLKPLATASAALGPLITGSLAAAKALNAIGQTSVALAPLVAFLPGLAASAGLLAYTLKGVGPALGSALAPVGAQFSKAQTQAANLATMGIAPIGKEWAKVNLPSISSAMSRIGVAANESLKTLGRFATSTAGTKLVRDVADGTAAAFERAGPAIAYAATELLALASRANIKGALGSLGGAVEDVAGSFALWASSVSSADIAGALNKAKSIFAAVGEKLSALRDVFGWLFGNADRLRGVSNAVSAFGLALGIATGNPVAIAIAAFSLLINNWNTLKAAFNSDAFQGFVQGFKDFANPIVREVTPALSELVATVKRDVVPALRTFLIAIQPIVQWLAKQLGPVVVIVFKAIVAVISGALKIISGVLNVFSGIITGKWSTIWKGVKQILSGAWQIILAIVSNGLKALGRLLASAVVAIYKTIVGLLSLVRKAGEGIGGALVSAGKAVASGFLSGIRAGWGAVTGAVQSLINRIPQQVRSLLGIASPSKVFTKIGEQTGQGLEAGLMASRTAVAKATDALISIPDGATAKIDLTASRASAPATSQPVVLRIDSAGSGLDALLLEVLRKSIRTQGGNVQLVLGR